MPTIRFIKPKTAIEVALGANLMTALQDGGTPVASSCGGEGVCAKCKVKVIAGSENLSPLTTAEQDGRDMDDLSRDERLSCQVQVEGDVTVDARYW